VRARTILLFHIISDRPSKQTRMVGSTLGVYIFGLIFVSARTYEGHHHHLPCCARATSRMRPPRVAVTPRTDLNANCSEQTDVDTRVHHSVQVVVVHLVHHKVEHDRGDTKVVCEHVLQRLR
jgi:hypothetical protein